MFCPTPDDAAPIESLIDWGLREPLPATQIMQPVLNCAPPRLEPSERVNTGHYLVEVAERFARAVAARHDEVRFFYSHNIADIKVCRAEPKTFKGAWPTNHGQPFAVHPCDDEGYRTLVFDIYAKSCDPELTSDQIKALLTQAGVRLVECRSGPEGSGHIFATWQERIPHSQMWRVFRAFTEKVDLPIDSSPMRNPKEGCIRPPLSKHYSWGRSRPVCDVYEALDVLETGNPPEAWQALAKTLGVPLLSPRMEELLFHSDAQGRYPSGSEMTQAVVMAHVNVGSTVEKCLEDLLDPNNEGGEEARSQRNPQKYIAHCWENAQEWAAQHPLVSTRPKTPAALATIRDAVEMYPWKGQAGQTNWAVLNAHLQIAERVGRIRYNASVRDLAQLAGVSSTETVTMANRRLRKRGWLTSFHRTGVGKAALWELRIPNDLRSVHTSLSEHETYGRNGGKESLIRPEDRQLQSHDIWRRSGGLGKGAARIYIALWEPRSMEDLAQALDPMKPRSVSRYLRLLAKYGLAVRNGDLWQRGTVTLDEAVKGMRVAGAGQRQKRRFDLDRQALSANRIVGSPLPDQPGRARKRRGLQAGDVVDKNTGEVIARKSQADPSGSPIQGRDLI